MGEEEIMIAIKNRAFAALMGLAAADAISWQALYHRSYVLPFWTRRIRREMDAESEDSNVIRLPMPFSLNQPASAFSIGPTDDTEWAVFTAKQLIDQSGKLDPGKLTAAWLELAHSEQPVRGTVGIQAALENLRRGKLPPVCGHDNPHYCDDSAMCRAVPIGIACAGQPDRAAEIAATDASMSNAKEGVLTAQAMAVIMSLLCIGRKFDEILDVILNMLHENSWLGSTVRRALAIGSASSSIFDMFPRLSDQIIHREYSYAGSAPETLALTLAIVNKGRGDFESAVFAAAAFARTADSVPPLVGAVSAAMMEKEFDYPQWLESLHVLKGICIPTLQGEDFFRIATDLARLAEVSASQSDEGQ